MSDSAIQKAADANFNWLRGCDYSGRGLVIGQSVDGTSAMMVYWLGGRSDNSRNRIFKKEGPAVSTAKFDESKGGDSSLTIYKAMMAMPGTNSMPRLPGHFVVSNGEQTVKVANEVHHAHYTLEKALATYMYEPDENSTPRITGLIRTSTKEEVPGTLELGILRKAPWSKACIRNFFTREMREDERGYGYCLTTYKGNGSPLPSFEGEPLVMPLADSMKSTLDAYWHVLSPKTRVAIAIMAINLETFETQFDTRDIHTET